MEAAAGASPGCSKALVPGKLKVEAAAPGKLKVEAAAPEEGDDALAEFGAAPQ